MVRLVGWLLVSDVMAVYVMTSQWTEALSPGPLGVSATSRVEAEVDGALGPASVPSMAELTAQAQETKARLATPTTALVSVCRVCRCSVLSKSPYMERWK